MNYKAFISYSHSADDKLAPALQAALHGFARPFYRLRALRVFRDKTSLHLTPALWPLIQQALASSEYFLLLCSPDAAQSPWVQNEVAEWLRLNGGADKLLLVLTEGEIVWDDAANDFEWARTNALPPNLRGVFGSEPLYADLRWARQATDLSVRNPQFLDVIGSLGATLHGRSKDELIGDDVRQHRVFRAVTTAAVVLLMALTAAASAAALYAVRQRDEARRQTAEAVRERNLATSRELAASADSQLGADPELSVLLSLKAHERTPTAEAENALRRSLLRSRVRAAFQTLNWYDVAYGPDPRWFILKSSVAQVVEVGTWRVIAELKGPGRNAGCRGVSISGDGRTVLVSTYDLDDQRTTVRLWDAASWRAIAELAVGQNDQLTSVLLSPDGRHAATWSLLPRGPHVWTLDTGTSLALGAPNARVNDAAFSPDSKTVVMATGGSASEGRAVRAWEVESGRLRYEFPCAGFWHGGLSFSPDGKYLAVICRDSRPRVVEAATGRTIVELDLDGLHTRPAFSPDGRFLVTAFDHVVRVWATDGWASASTLFGHTGVVSHQAFSRDGRVLVTSSDDGTARVWEVETWRSLSVLQGHSMPMVDLGVSPDARYIVTTAKDSRARVWEPNLTGSDVSLLDGSIDNGMADDRPDAFSPDGKLVATRNAAGVVDVREADTTRTVASLGRGNFLGFSPDGSYAFKATISPADRRISIAEVWDARTWRHAASLSGHPGPITDLAFSRDGRLAATGGEDVIVWEVETGRRVATLSYQGWRVAFSPDGKWLAAAGPEPTPRVWAVGPWTLAAELRGHSAWVRAIAFSRDGTRLVTAGEDETARLWETGTWRSVAVLAGHTDRVAEAGLSPDGRYVATASWDKTARLWQAATGKLVAVLEGHTDMVNGVAFSPDGRLLATGGDSTVRLWNGTSGRVVTVLQVFTRGLDSSGSVRTIMTVLFSPDGRSLLAGGSDGATRIFGWEMFAPLDALLTVGRTRVTRDFSTDERRIYLHESTQRNDEPTRRQ